MPLRNKHVAPHLTGMICEDHTTIQAACTYPCISQNLPDSSFKEIVSCYQFGGFLPPTTKLL